MNEETELERLSRLVRTLREKQKIELSKAKEHTDRADGIGISAVAVEDALDSLKAKKS